MGHEYVKENETFNTSKNGVVPKPTASDVSNNKVLRADGSWVTQSGGGGGSSSLSGLDDVNLTSPTNGQLLQFDSTSQKWVNANKPMHNYSTSEQVVGTWIDGKPLYEKTISSDAERDGSVSTSQAIAHGISNLKEVITINGFASFGNNGSWLPIIFSDNAGATLSNSRVKIINIGLSNVNFEIGNNYNGNNKINKVRITLRYTKTTD